MRYACAPLFLLKSLACGERLRHGWRNARRAAASACASHLSISISVSMRTRQTRLRAAAAGGMRLRHCAPLGEGDRMPLWARLLYRTAPSLFSTSDGAACVAAGGAAVCGDISAAGLLWRCVV